jgi:hypothetical protein
MKYLGWVFVSYIITTVIYWYSPFKDNVNNWISESIHAMYSFVSFLMALGETKESYSELYNIVAWYFTS